MSERRAVHHYDRLLASIGESAQAIGDRRLASHWPHVGTAYRGLVIAGQALEPVRTGPWYSRFAWANVYPVGPDDPPGSPGGALKEAQDLYVGDLFAALLDTLDARRVVVISGPAYWLHPARSSWFRDLPMAADFPLLRAGRADGRVVVVGYHPTYARRQKVGARTYAERVTHAIRSLERSG